jgi:hypothetical protein
MRWQDGSLSMRNKWIVVGLGLFATVGIAVGIGLLVVGGAFGSDLVRGRVFPPLLTLAPFGLVPLAAAVVAGYWLNKENRRMVLTSFAGGCVLFVALLAAVGPGLLNGHKASATLADAVATHLQEREVRLGCFGYYQPSLVFYGQRKVEKIQSRDDAVDWLRSKTQVFLFLPEAEWRRVRKEAPDTCREVARHYELYAGKEILAVTNVPPPEARDQQQVSLHLGK